MFLGGSKETDTTANVHTPRLKGKVRFVAYPPRDCRDVLRYSKRCFTDKKHGRNDPNVAFVGQLPKLLPLIYVAWAVDLLLRDYATRWVLQTQPNGCAKVRVDSESQLAQLLKLNRALMFDVNGIWVGETETEIAIIREYQESITTTADQRVPRYGMTVQNNTNAFERGAVAPPHPAGGLPPSSVPLAAIPTVRIGKMTSPLPGQPRPGPGVYLPASFRQPLPDRAVQTQRPNAAAQEGPARMPVPHGTADSAMAKPHETPAHGKSATPYVPQPARPCPAPTPVGLSNDDVTGRFRAWDASGDPTW